MAIKKRWAKDAAKENLTYAQTQEIIKYLDAFSKLSRSWAAVPEIHSIEVTPHALRHTRATFLAEDGMSKDALQNFLGHELGETTEIYTETAAIDVGRSFRVATAMKQN